MGTLVWRQVVTPGGHGAQCARFRKDRSGLVLLNRTQVSAHRPSLRMRTESSVQRSCFA